jgi:hypothetical protein
MRGGRSAARRTFRFRGSISTAGSRSGPPPQGAGKRSCSASPKLAARDRRSPNPWASAHREAAALGFAGLRRPSDDLSLWALRTRLDSWAGIGHVTVGMARQGFDLQLTQYDERGWRATFYTTGMEHSPTSATGTGWERTPWHATQRAAWEALRNVSRDGLGGTPLCSQI